MADPGVISCLRLTSCSLAAVLFGILMTWPAIVLPAIESTIGFNHKDRFRFWMSYHRRVTPFTSLLLPLLTITLSLSALFAQSASTTVHLEGDYSGLINLVRNNRKSLFITSAILTLAHRPFAFSFLVPRQELLFEHDKRQLMRFTGTSLSPVESEDEDTEYDSSTGLNEKIHMGGARRTIDTDEVIRDLTQLQIGPIVLSTLTFALTLLELLCV